MSDTQTTTTTTKTETTFHTHTVVTFHVGPPDRSAEKREADKARMDLAAEKMEHEQALALADARIVELEAMIHRFETAFNDVLSRAEHAEQQIQALQKDKARMDFLETIPNDVQRGVISYSCYYGGGRYTGKTKREATDKAMQAASEVAQVAGQKGSEGGIG